jgi:hypothetical protein
MIGHNAIRIERSMEGVEAMFVEESEQVTEGWM